MSAQILIVDDLPFMRKVLSDMLVDLGHEVVGQGVDGIHGYQLYQELEPDLVFLDIVMPRLDGLSTLERILDYNREAKVIMCSALNDRGTVMRAMRRGALDYVVKPIRRERVASVVRSALGQ